MKLQMRLIDMPRYLTQAVSFIHGHSDRGVPAA